MWNNEFCILQDWETALILACYWEKSEIINLLLKAGARTDLQEKVAIAQSALATYDNVMLYIGWPDSSLLGCPSWLCQHSPDFSRPWCSCGPWQR